MSTITIYHNPACGTSRKTLAAIRESGAEPEVIEYLKTPLSREGLVSLLGKLSISARELLRDKGGLYEELGLNNKDISDDALIDAMAKHPSLMNRPVVVTAKGARLCRPYELVQDLL